MIAEVISIGDELLIGQVVNTNAAWLGQRFSELGVDVSRVLSVGDSRDVITAEIGAASERADVVIVTGGLGPTHDDVTKEAVASLYGVSLEFHQDLFDALKARYDRAGMTMSASNRTQAEVPAGFEVLPNQWGSAPGLLHDGETMLVVLPGVPREMKGLMDEYVFPRLISAGGLTPLVRRTLLTTGIAESQLHDSIGPLEDWTQRGCSLAYLPNIHGVRMRLTAPDPALLSEFEAFLRGHAGRHIYGEGGQTLEEVVGQMLVERDWTVATAESCTGGLVASRLTDVPGASRYVRGCVVAYDNEVKTRHLGVDSDLLDARGAVSREVVIQMAAGVRGVIGTDVGIATSGIMGPGGGSPEKPVGTAWMAVQTPIHTHSLKVVLRHERVDNKARTATTVLDLLRRTMLK